MKGSFSKNLFSLQMQLKTLVEDAGGEEALDLLDSLADLNPSERRIVLRSMNRMIQNFTDGNKRFETEGDLALKRFEDELFEDLVSDIEVELKTRKKKTSRRLEVLCGGKDKAENEKLVDLAAIRKAKESEDADILN